jgi:hypothetical protein
MKRQEACHNANVRIVYHKLELTQVLIGMSKD